MNMRSWIAHVGLLLVVLCAACTATSYGQQPAPLEQFPTGKLAIATPDTRVHAFKVWIAADNPHREQGLMFVKQIPDDTGMLFVYTTPQHIAMWMKNTVLPLDMIFIRADGRVVRIEANTKPQSLRTIESGEPVLGVLEVKAGTAARLNIRAGAIVIHEAFGNAK